jgi:hypothetical protein
MPRIHDIVSALRFVPWILAGAVFFGAEAPATAQDATPAAIEVASATTVTPAEPSATTAAGSAGEAGPSTMPSAGVGLASGGTWPLSLGALVGAGVAALFALRERLKSR